MSSVFIKTLEPSDLDEVEGIELENNIDPWDESKFREFFRSKLHRGIVCVLCDDDCDPMVIGFALYQIVPEENRIILSDVSVDPDFLREGVGTSLFHYVYNIAEFSYFSVLSAYVREKNIVGQLFLQSCGFLWSETMRDDEEDIYEMERGVRKCLPLEVEIV